MNSPNGSTAPACSGIPIWLRRSVRRREVVLPGRLDQLPGRPALDASQGDVSRLDLIGFHPLSERFGQAVVEVGELLGQAVLLAAVSGRLEESISLDKRRQLGLDNDPLLLIKRGLGNVVAMGGLVPELDGLSQRDINDNFDHSDKSPGCGP